MFLVHGSSFGCQFLLLLRTLLQVPYQYVQGFQQSYNYINPEGENCYEGLSRR